jgi:L-threonylcarbamoyladenylate synthase
VPSIIVLDTRQYWNVHADDHDALDATAACLLGGGVAIIPTDTVYGLAALPTQADAVRLLYSVKGRPGQMHLPVLGATVTQVLDLGIEMTGPAQALAERFWPGPLTMVLGFDPGTARPPWLSGRDEVAVRLPRHDFLAALLARTGVLLVTSANLHGMATPPSAAVASDMLGSRVGLVIDGGPLDGAPSTLVNVRHGGATVERVGALDPAAIAAALDGAGGLGGTA